MIECVQRYEQREYTIVEVPMQEKPTPMPDLVPLTDMRRRAGAVIDELHDDRATIVTSFGRPVAVLVSPYLWERLTEATS